MIFNCGAPSRIDLWYPKPDAPAEVRGTFSPIKTGPRFKIDGRCRSQRCILAKRLQVGANTAKMLANYDVHWFEDALHPDAFEDYAKLREHSTVPISGGEVLTRRQAFQPFLEARAFDIIQPDVTKVGGISEERRIARMAQEHGIGFIPNGWNAAVGLAADLQLASAFPSTDLVEYLTGSPFIDEITAGGWKLDPDGMLAIPFTPGLGLELDPEAVSKYTGGEKLL